MRLFQPAPSVAGGDIRYRRRPHAEKIRELGLVEMVPVRPDPAHVIRAKFFGAIRPIDTVLKGDVSRRSLLLPSCPSTVARPITQERLDSIQAVLIGRAAAHVSEEIFVLSPSRAHANAKSGVVPLVFVLSVIASEKHCGPCPVLNRTCIAVARLEARADRSTATRFSRARSAIENTVLVDSLDRAAVTGALPDIIMGRRAAGSQKFPHDKFSETHPCNVFCHDRK